MLKLTDTPNHFGVQIHGDYQDLYELRKSVNNYLDFYSEGQVHGLTAMRDTGQITENRFQVLSKNEYILHEYLLALCYDLRHAYQGSRDVEFVDNHSDNIGLEAECICELPNDARREFSAQRKKGSNGNIYYSVPVLYPLTVFYALQLTDILDNYYEPEWFEYVDFEYTRLQAEQDRSMIRLLVTMFFNNLSSFLGNETALNLYDYLNYSESINSSTTFPEAMCQYYVTATENEPENAELKKAILTVIIYEMISSEGLSDDESPSYNEASEKVFSNARRIYKQACSVIRKYTGKQFTPYDEYEKQLAAFVLKNGGKLYQNVFDDYLDREYGGYNWNNLKW